MWCINVQKKKFECGSCFFHPRLFELELETILCVPKTITYRFKKVTYSCIDLQSLQNGISTKKSCGTDVVPFFH